MTLDVWRILIGLCGLFFVAVGSASGGLIYSNSNLITISGSPSPPTVASPYPSAIIVSGLDGQVVTKISVAFLGLSHQFPSDISALLVGPQGQEALLMSQAGGQQKYSVTNLTLTFDDDATNSLPLFTNLVSGTFKPTDGWKDPYFGDPGGVLPYDFPPPAPPGNSNAVDSLSVFKNTDPTGTWNLFVLSDSGPWSGSISNGWSMDLSVGVPLRIDSSETNIVLSWPASAPNYSLQSTANPFTSNAWNTAGPAPLLIGNRYFVTNDILNENAFFRLISQ